MRRGVNLYIYETQKGERKKKNGWSEKLMPSLSYSISIT